MSDKKALTAARDRQRDYTRSQQREVDALEMLVGMDETGIDTACANYWAKEIELTAEGGAARDVAIRALGHLRQTNPIFAESNVIKATKSFDETTGKVTFSFVAGEWTINVRGGDARCEVESYEEPRYIPATPARTEVVKRFRLKDPEACGAAAKEA